MNILLICKRHYTNKDLIREKFGRLYHFPHYWHAAGHAVTVIAADYLSFHNSVHDIDGMICHSLGFPSLLADFLMRVRGIARNTRPDIVIASGDSHIGYIGLRLARKSGVPFVFDLYHHYADFGSNRIPGMKSMYYRALQDADLVVCDSLPLQHKVAPRARRTMIAAQGTDPAQFRSLDKATCRQQLALDPDATYIGYTGALDSRFDYDCLTSAMESIIDRGRPLRLLVAGPNIARYDLDRDYIDYLGTLPQERIPQVINACDVMCIPYRNTELASTCNPCKLSEYIYCGLPLVASSISNITQYLPVSAERCYTPGEPAALAAAIVRQLDDPLPEPPDSSLTWQAIGQHYLDALSGLGNPASG